jgi:hypothetical protein
MEIQTDYAKHAYDAHVSEVSKLGEMSVYLLTSAYKPVERGRRSFD